MINYCWVYEYCRHQHIRDITRIINYFRIYECRSPQPIADIDKKKNDRKVIYANYEKKRAEDEDFKIRKQAMLGSVGAMEK